VCNIYILVLAFSILFDLFLSLILLYIYWHFLCLSCSIFLCVSVHFLFFSFIIVCLALSRMTANYFFFSKKNILLFFFFLFVQTLSIRVTFSICSSQPEKKKRIYVELDRYTYMCDGCIFGIKPTHCECWFQLKY
jgi:hypothetical protein